MDVYKKLEFVTLFGEPCVVHEIWLGDKPKYIALEHDQDWPLIAEVFARSFRSARGI